MKATKSWSRAATAALLIIATAFSGCSTPTRPTGSTTSGESTVSGAQAAEPTLVNLSVALRAATSLRLSMSTSDGVTRTITADANAVGELDEVVVDGQAICTSAQCVATLDRPTIVAVVVEAVILALTVKAGWDVYHRIVSLAEADRAKNNGYVSWETAGKVVEEGAIFLGSEVAANAVGNQLTKIGINNVRSTVAGMFREAVSQDQVYTLFNRANFGVAVDVTEQVASTLFEKVFRGLFNLLHRTATTPTPTPTPAPPSAPLAIGTASMPGAKAGSSYSVALVATGGTAPYHWSIANGTLPGGLSIGGLSGVVAGTAAVVGTSAFVIKVEDSAAPPQSALKSFSIVVDAATSSGGAFSATATAECGSGVPQVRLSWSASSGADFYQIFRNGVLLEGVSLTNRSYLDTAVSLGAQYSYYVRAIGAGGQTDSPTATVTASCSVPPGAFTLAGNPSCSNAAPVNALIWGGAVGRTLPDELYRNGSLLASLTASSYSDTAVVAGSSYTYMVKARNTTGSTDSNSVVVSTKSDCAAPVAPTVTSITPASVTVGGGSDVITISGTNFDSGARLLWDYAGSTPSTLLTPTYVNPTTLTLTLTATSFGFSPLPGGALSLVMQVLKPGPNVFDGLKSNTVTFRVLNPSPTVSSVAGTCRANLNCTPTNGFDVRVNGGGFVNNSYNGNGSTTSTSLTVNGAAANRQFVGSGPVYGQMQLLINGSLIPTAGNYTLQVCNAGTSSGTACATTTLRVDP